MKDYEQPVVEHRHLGAAEAAIAKPESTTGEYSISETRELISLLVMSQPLVS